MAESKIAFQRRLDDGRISGGSVRFRARRSEIGSFRLSCSFPSQNGIVEALPAEGIEPTRSCDHWILSPARLPVPPRRQIDYPVQFIRTLFLCRKSVVDSMLTVWHDFGYQNSQSVK